MLHVPSVYHEAAGGWGPGGGRTEGPSSSWTPSHAVSASGRFALQPSGLNHHLQPFFRERPPCISALCVSFSRQKREELAQKVAEERARREEESRRLETEQAREREEQREEQLRRQAEERERRERREREDLERAQKQVGEPPPPARRAGQSPQRSVCVCVCPAPALPPPHPVPPPPGSPSGLKHRPTFCFQKEEEARLREEAERVRQEREKHFQREEQERLERKKVIVSRPEAWGAHCPHSSPALKPQDQETSSLLSESKRALRIPEKPKSLRVFIIISKDICPHSADRTQTVPSRSCGLSQLQPWCE